jgi:hypothetical protein
MVGVRLNRSASWNGRCFAGGMRRRHHHIAVSLGKRAKAHGHARGFGGVGLG